MVPWDKIRQSVDGELVREEYGLADIRRLVELVPMEMFGVGAYIWHRGVITDEVGPADKLGPLFGQESPTLYETVASELGQPSILDIYYAKAWLDGKEGDNFVAEVLLAQIWPGELYLADVNFENPHAPLSTKERLLHKQQRTHRGLAAFGDLVDGMCSYGKSQRLKAVSLTAAHHELVEVFKRYGFHVENSSFARDALKQRNGGVPMRIAL